jgi:hypothetical protein
MATLWQPGHGARASEKESREALTPRAVGLSTRTPDRSLRRSQAHQVSVDRVTL